MKKKFQVLKQGVKVTLSSDELKQILGGTVRPSGIGCGGPNECLAAPK